MKIEIDQKDKNTVQLDVEIEADEVLKEYHKSCKKISQRVSIPGFRKGKAPRNIVENYIGVEKIKQDALDRLLPNIFAEVISEKQLDVISEPIVENITFDLGNPLTLVAKIELKPEVKAADYKGITVDVEKYNVTDNYVDNQLKTLSEKYATVNIVINRETQEKDIVSIDYAGTVNGEPIRGGSAKNKMFEINQENDYLPEFSKQLVGRKRGEEFTIEVTFPDQYPDKNLAGKEAVFDVKINEIKEKVIPVIDDEFAKKVTEGKITTLEALKEDIQKYGDKVADIETEYRIKGALVEKIVNESTVEVSDSLINREAKVLLEEVQMDLKSRGISWEEMLDNKSYETIWEELRQEALKRIKTSLVLSQIAETENIELKEEDFDKRIKQMALYYNTDDRSIIKKLESSKGLTRALGNQMLSHKIINFLISVNEVNFIEPTETSEKSLAASSTIQDYTVDSE